MFSLILAVYLISGGGAVSVHTQQLHNYSTQQSCQAAGTKLQADLSPKDLNELPGGRGFTTVVVKFSCVSNN